MEYLVALLVVAMISGSAFLRGALDGRDNMRRKYKIAQKRIRVLEKQLKGDK